MTIKDKIESLTFWFTLLFSVTLAYFVWLTWQKLTGLLGESIWIWGITGAIVLLGVLSGFLGIKKIVEEFT